MGEFHDTNIAVEILKDSITDVPNEENASKEEYTNFTENSNKASFSYENENVKSYIKNANNAVLINCLSPEISNNEKVKRKHKTFLITVLIIFLILGFVSSFALIWVLLQSIIKSHELQNDFSTNYLQIVITIVATFITSIVVEFIAMLRYVVKSVFDTSITDLLTIFKDDNNINNQTN